ncbi:MAG: alternative ribosome rescue aminoacyl-tRNA hydrolase ArfB [Fuerstiella sp.]
MSEPGTVPQIHGRRRSSTDRSVRTLASETDLPDNQEMLHVNDHIQIAESEFDFSFVRSGGPGGQNVNKVNSKAMMRWDATASEALPPGVRQRFMARYGHRLTKEGVLILRSQKYRDQARNSADCMERLRQMILEVAAPPTKRRPTRPSRGARQRRLQEKKKASQKKQSRRRPSLGD